MEWATAETFDYSIITNAKICKNPKGRPGKIKRLSYLDILCAFDIETSRVPGLEQSGLYHWQMQIGEDTKTIHGRTWDDLRTALFAIENAIPEGKTLLIFCHNFSYEWEFLRTVIDWKPEDVFAIKSRKILYARSHNQKIEWRCSYLLTNKSLSKWTNDYKVPHAKKDSEEFNHNLVRYPWDELSETELEYCQNDVLGLVEALRIELLNENDNLASLPLTSTGFVRRDFKHAMNLFSRLTMTAIQPNVAVYKLLHSAFTGGNTHANRYYTGEILDSVRSVDRSSSYPDVIVNCKFPMSAFRPWIENTEAELNRLLKRKRALLIRATFYDFRLRDKLIGCPPLSYSKCVNCSESSLDNGRILWASRLTTTFTDIDYQIFCEAYTWERIEIEEAYQARYDYLPEPIRELTKQYYRLKTNLKGVPGRELDYGLAKARLNSIYGMMAQDICRCETRFEPKNIKEQFKSVLPDFEKKCNDLKYGHPFRCYSWGIWVTSLSRLRLWEAIRLADSPDGNYSFVYCDTDSLKYISDAPVDTAEYNKARISDSLKNGAYADDPNGNRHFMGVLEEEGCYTFRTWGAKKYVTVNEQKLDITIAGVVKKPGKIELEKAGGISAFEPGFVFREAGGLEAVYNDCTRETIEINGHKWELGPNVYLRPSTYTVNIKPEYESLIFDPELYEKIREEFIKW